MKNHVAFLALLLLAMPVFAMSSYPGGYPSKGDASDDDSNPRLRMDLHVWEDCGRIFVEAVSGGTLGDGKGIPGVFVDVIALPRDGGILLLAEGYTDEYGIFAFNTSSKNFSVSASKDGYYSEQAEFAPQGVSCAEPELTIDLVYDCAKKGALVRVMSEGNPLADAQVLVDGDDAGLTGPDGYRFVSFSEKSNVSASAGNQVAAKEFAPDCPQENRTGNVSVAPPADEVLPPAPSPQPLDLPLIAGAVILAISLIYLLTRGGRKIGPGPMKPKAIGPGPMKPGEIGPGPMSENIGPGPMKPKEIGPGPM